MVDIPQLNPEVYTLANSGYGNRMIKTNESQITLYVRYERKLCNIYYILRHGDDGQKPINYGPLGDDSQILLQHRITSNNDLILPYFGHLNRISFQRLLHWSKWNW